MKDAEFIIKTIGSLNRYFQRSIQKKVEQSGVTLPQMRVIQEVVKHQGISIKDLSFTLNMSQSTVSGIVERLINKGFLLKKTNSQDKRFTEIWYTRRVATFLEKNSSEFVSEALSDALSHLQPADWEIIKRGMLLLLSAVEQADRSMGTMEDHQ